MEQATAGQARRSFPVRRARAGRGAKDLNSQPWWAGRNGEGARVPSIQSSKQARPRLFALHEPAAFSRRAL